MSVGPVSLGKLEYQGVYRSQWIDCVCVCTEVRHGYLNHSILRFQIPHTGSTLLLSTSEVFVLHLLWCVCVGGGGGGGCMQ